MFDDCFRTELNDRSVTRSDRTKKRHRMSSKLLILARRVAWANKSHGRIYRLTVNLGLYNVADNR